jgi:hypothetical protein
MHITFRPAPGNLAIVALFRADGLHINGKATPWPDVPDVIEYGEQAGVSTACDPSLGHTYEIEASTWTDPNPAPPPERDPEAEAQAALESWRATAAADAWQIAFILGEARWQALEDWANGYFNTRILVAKATLIPRASDTVALMAWVLGLTDAEVDAVFRQAAMIRA